ncbi:MAG: response regulator [Candidatus Melainabacteria bacterium]|nr:response regulator [Candidatus Melainabacteria bacterium]
MAKKILVVDPDPQFRKLIVPIFESRGHKVTQAETGEVGLEVIKTEFPELVLVGAPLPGISAEVWLEKARALTKNVPIVFVAGDKVELNEMKPRLGKLNLAMISSKPLIPFVFGARVESVFNQDQGSEAQKKKLKDFETMFLNMVTKYAKVLPEKLSEVARAVEAAKADPGNRGLLEEVRGLAHKIKGTGGSLGFKRVGEHMAFIEDTAVSMAEKDEDERAHLWSEIDRTLVDAQHDGEVEAQEVMEAVQGAEDDKDNQEDRDEKEDTGEHQPSMARIMVVDEDEEFLGFIEDLGKESLVEIVRAVNEKEALDKAAHFPLDAALINVVAEMPEAGFKLARELRSLPGYDNLPLAFISGDAQVKDRVEAAHAGASLYLDKPFKPDSLDKAVQHLVAIRQGGRPKVLITDDDEFFANTVALVLRNEGMIVKTLNDPNKITEVMQEFPPDMLLLDVMMPGITGFDVCRSLREIPRWRDLPIIFLTGQTGVEARVEAFRCGGDDYLPKPVVNEELLTRVKVRLDRAHLLRERSDKDTITGLLLRRAFSEQLSAILAESERIKSNFTICLLDVDHFKKVNDTYGHLSGDRVLAELGSLLGRRFRVDDLRGRWGGEEFILAFRRERKEIMHKAVDRVLAEFRNMTFESDDGVQFNCSFSGGLATFPDDGESIFDLVHTADQRLYLAKKLGRNQVVVTGENEDSKTETAAAK